MELTKRPRRLRGSENLRKMVRETRMDKSSLIAWIVFPINWSSFPKQVLAV